MDDRANDEIVDHVSEFRGEVHKGIHVVRLQS